MENKYTINIEFGDFEERNETYDSKEKADARYDELMKLKEKPSMHGLEVRKLYDNELSYKGFKITSDHGLGWKHYVVHTPGGKFVYPDLDSIKLDIDNHDPELFGEQISEQADSSDKSDVEEEAKWAEVRKPLGGRGEFLGKIDEYRDTPIYKYRGGDNSQEIIYFMTGSNVASDRFEFDAEDEEAAIKCIDILLDKGEDAADAYWQSFYYDYNEINESSKMDIEYNVYVGDELFDVVDNPEEAKSLIEQEPEITRIDKVTRKEHSKDCDVEVFYKKSDRKRNSKMSAKERFKLIDDEVDEEVEDIPTIYSVSYVVNNGPYQAIMVKANSEEEAVEKFKKQNPTADVIAAGIEYDPEEMRRRGKPLMEEIQDDLSVRKWYMTAFPHDELGYEIKDDINFEGLDEVLEQGRDVYEYLGVADSIVRERIFDKLADLTGVDYDDIYEKWINNQEDAEREARVEAEAEDEE